MNDSRWDFIVNSLCVSMTSATIFSHEASQVYAALFVVAKMSGGKEKAHIDL